MAGQTGRRKLTRDPWCRGAAKNPRGQPRTFKAHRSRFWSESGSRQSQLLTETVPRCGPWGRIPNVLFEIQPTRPLIDGGPLSYCFTVVWSPSTGSTTSGREEIGSPSSCLICGNADQHHAPDDPCALCRVDRRINACGEAHAPDSPGTGEFLSINANSRRSAHSAAGIGARSSLQIVETSSAFAAPGMIEATAGWARGNCSAAARRPTPYDWQISAMRHVLARMSVNSRAIVTP